MVEADVPVSSDLNVFDSFHEAMPHPHLTDGAWTSAYLHAWRRFYSFENMKAVLSRAHPDNYWDIFLNFFWYKNSVLNEGAHPMITGFFPLKDRKSRRTTFPREGRLAHALRRAPEICRYLGDALRLTLEMEELWLQTRTRSETERCVLEELTRMRKELQRSLRLTEFQLAYAAGQVASTVCGGSLALQVGVRTLRLLSGKPEVGKPRGIDPVLDRHPTTFAPGTHRGSLAGGPNPDERHARAPPGRGVHNRPHYAWAHRSTASGA
jgi:hypothetical protein